MLDEERTLAAHERRRRALNLQRQAQEEATLKGALVDLGEKRVPVTIKTGAGTTQVGIIIAVGHDFVSLRTRDGAQTLCVLSELCAIRTNSGAQHVPAAGGRGETHDLYLRELLDKATEEEAWVALTMNTGEVISGNLFALGADVVTLRVEDDGSGITYVSLSRVAEVRFFSASRWPNEPGWIKAPEM